MPRPSIPTTWSNGPLKAVEIASVGNRWPDDAAPTLFVQCIPTFLVFGVLCQRVSLKKLLWWGTIVAIPQFVPLLFVHSTTGALIAAAPIGLLGGVATAAYLDLIIRSCPSGLQGTMMMFSGGLYYVSSRFGDVLGTWLYDYFGGFGICVAMITIVYALILPVLLTIPDNIVEFVDAI